MTNATYPSSDPQSAPTDSDPPQLIRPSAGAAAVGMPRDPLERGVVMAGKQGPLIGVHTRAAGAPQELRQHAAPGVLIVAPQRQTRTGAHRMFVTLARRLSAGGVASLRFDIGGWGDSPGEMRTVENSVDDIGVAARELRARIGAGPLILVGLGDGACAATLALPVINKSGLEADAIVLLNPWLGTESDPAQASGVTLLRPRWFQRAFWRRQFGGPADGMAEHVTHEPSSSPAAGSEPTRAAVSDLHNDLLQCLQDTRTKLWTVLASADPAAAETEALFKRSRVWRKLLDRSDNILRIEAADHTFSEKDHWQQVANWLIRKCHSLHD